MKDPGLLNFVPPPSKSLMCKTSVAGVAKLQTNKQTNKQAMSIVNKKIKYCMLASYIAIRHSSPTITVEPQSKMTVDMHTGYHVITTYGVACPLSGCL